MTVITVENLGKCYQIGHQRQERYSTLRDVMMHTTRGLWQRVRHPLSPNKEEVDIEELWALKEVHFEVRQGERIGIIGRNGAGKSTLLKILSQITDPTTGRVRLKGRVASLLEVGTGFHPELTGRENIYLNGAILGMTRQEIKHKFDKIVAFAGVEQFLDTPVKRFSSGMYVRLAFAVAAHLEPEILLVDEVLAVGDAAFQKKCLGKMEEVAEQEGRTVLFVSHNMLAIQTLCQRAIALQKGAVVMDGSVQDTIAYYLDHQTPTHASLRTRSDRQGTGEMRFTDAWVENEDGDVVDTVYSGQNISLVATYETLQHTPLRAFSVTFALNGSMGEQLADLGNESTGEDWGHVPLYGKIRCQLPNLPLNTGRYSFNVCGHMNNAVTDWVTQAAVFHVEAGDFLGSGRLPSHDQGSFLFHQSWELLPSEARDDEYNSQLSREEE